MTRPQTVIFDLGGVLIDWNPRYLYRKLLKDDEAVEHFLATICTPAWNQQQDAGRPIAEAVAQLTTRWPQEAALIAAYYDRWTEMLGGPIEETVDVLAALRQRDVPLFALTNWSAETFPYVSGQYDFLGWFQGIVVSGREKMKKPDRRLYQVLLDRYSLAAHDTVFIDDSPANVEAARELGLHGLHFTTAPALRRELEGLGLL